MMHQEAMWMSVVCAADSSLRMRKFEGTPTPTKERDQTGSPSRYNRKHLHDIIESIDTTVNENANNKKLLTQNVQETQDTWIIGIEES